jgi:NADPH:quinone reductase-like Zn-dependent oxidoreductase
MASKTTSATAWQYNKRGPLPSTLEKKEVQIPSLEPGQVLIKVHAAALNPVDWKVAGAMPSLVNKMPHTAGADFAGEVVSVQPSKEWQGQGNDDLDWLKEGAKVYGILPVDEAFKTGWGTLSTYAIAKSTAIGLIPKEMSFEDASGITLTGLTAATLAARVKPKDRVLILGGTTTVGLLLIQMCIAEGASHVVATCSSSKSSAVKKAGAHEFIDYQSGAVSQLESKYSSDPFDIILDCVGSFDTYRACPSFLKKDSTYVNIGASSFDISRLFRSVGAFAKNTIQTLILPAMLGGTPRKYVTTGLDVKYMPELRKYIDSGKVKPWTDSVFAFSDTPKAYEYLIKGRALGKVVVKVVD